MRVGITGVPGVGKSTFIESIGKQLTESGHKVAVLAVDPASAISGGSVLGDKTRMAELARDPSAFIRPTSGGDSRGGVARRTREAGLLCEAAGFDVVFIETIGVGQAETAVRDMVDCFVMLQLARAGDDLQGIKRGVMELADIVVVHKADGDNLQAAGEAQLDLQLSLELLQPRTEGWRVPVLLASSLNGNGLAEVWQQVLIHRGHLENERGARDRAQAPGRPVDEDRGIRRAAARVPHPSGSKPVPCRSCA